MSNYIILHILTHGKSSNTIIVAFTFNPSI